MLDADCRLRRVADEAPRSCPSRRPAVARADCTMPSLTSDASPVSSFIAANAPAVLASSSTRASRAESSVDRNDSRRAARSSDRRRACPDAASTCSGTPSVAATTASYFEGAPVSEVPASTSRRRRRLASSFSRDPKAETVEMAPAPLPSARALSAADALPETKEVTSSSLASSATGGLLRTCVHLVAVVPSASFTYTMRVTR